MNGKITWSEIYSDFRRRHPNLSKGVLDYRPHDYLTIKIIFRDGSEMVYDYDSKRATFIKHAETEHSNP